jgi:hypothetical protein
MSTIRKSWDHAFSLMAINCLLIDTMSQYFYGKRESLELSGYPTFTTLGAKHTQHCCFPPSKRLPCVSAGQQQEPACGSSVKTVEVTVRQVSGKPSLTVLAEHRKRTMGKANGSCQ